LKREVDEKKNLSKKERRELGNGVREKRCVQNKKKKKKRRRRVPTKKIVDEEIIVRAVKRRHAVKRGIHAKQKL